MVVAHCAFSFGQKNGELYQLATFLRKLQLLSETAKAVRDQLNQTISVASAAIASPVPANNYLAVLTTVTKP